MFGAAFDQKTYSDFRIKARLIRRLEILIHGKDQPVSTRAQLWLAQNKSFDAAIIIGYPFGQSRPAFARIQNLQADADTGGRTAPRGIENVRGDCAHKVSSNESTFPPAGTIHLLPDAGPRFFFELPLV